MDTVQLAVRRVCADPEVRSQANLARMLGRQCGRCSPARIQQWLTGKRPVPPHFCPAIERFTQSRVRVWELRPTDWHLIWPALVGTAGAPALPVAANDAQALEVA
jgi:DNA-binding transcriptional regulator YdaS (Cro superfamily)